MSSLASSAAEYYPAAGVKSDIEQLLLKFAAANSIRYCDFIKVWKEVKFSMIFAGRQTDKECREFTEECMHIAVHFLMPDFQFQARVGVLYLLYGLYFKQPFDPKVKIRLTCTQWKECLLFLDYVQSQGHSDVEYIFHRLRYEHAYHFVATPTQLFPTMRGVSGNETNVAQRLECLVEQKTVLGEIMEPDNIDQLSAIHEQYHRMKYSLMGDQSTQELPPAYNVIEGQLVQYITKAVTQFDEWRKERVGRKGVRKRRDSATTVSESDAELSDVETGQSQSIGSVRADLKARAFSASTVGSKSRRHRQAAVSDSPSKTPKVEGKKSRRVSNQEPSYDGAVDVAVLQDHFREVMKNMPDFVNGDLNDLPGTAKEKRVESRKRSKGSDSSAERTALPKSSASKRKKIDRKKPKKGESEKAKNENKEAEETMERENRGEKNGKSSKKGKRKSTKQREAGSQSSQRVEEETRTLEKENQGTETEKRNEAAKEVEIETSSPGRKGRKKRKELKKVSEEENDEPDKEVDVVGNESEERKESSRNTSKERSEVEESKRDPKEVKIKMFSSSTTEGKGKKKRKELKSMAVGKEEDIVRKESEENELSRNTSKDRREMGESQRAVVEIEMSSSSTTTRGKGKKKRQESKSQEKELDNVDKTVVETLSKERNDEKQLQGSKSVAEENATIIEKFPGGKAKRKKESSKGGKTASGDEGKEGEAGLETNKETENRKQFQEKTSEERIETVEMSLSQEGQNTTKPQCEEIVGSKGISIAKKGRTKRDKESPEKEEGGVRVVRMEKGKRLAIEIEPLFPIQKDQEREVDVSTKNKISEEVIKESVGIGDKAATRSRKGRPRKNADSQEKEVD